MAEQEVQVNMNRSVVINSALDYLEWWNGGIVD